MLSKPLKNLILYCKSGIFKELPGCQEVKMFPSNAGRMGSTPVREVRSLMPRGQKKKKKKKNPQKQTRSNIVTNSIKTLKMVHMKKEIFKKKMKSRVFGIR